MTSRPRKPDRGASHRRIGLVSGLVIVLGLTVLRTLPAQADRDLSRGEFVELANTRPVPVAELSAVTSVDGQPIDTSMLLRGAPADVEQRLQTLVSLLPTPNGEDAGQARNDAKDILAERRFQKSKIPRPFAGALRWLGDQLAKIARPLAPIFANKLTAITFMVVSFALAAKLLVSLARRRQRHVGRDLHNPDQRWQQLRDLQPDQLDDDADAAARAGDLDRALRLRFLAGLLRLDRSGKLAYSPTATAHALRESMASPVFDGLAGRHDEVAYGARTATDQDLEEAITGWAELTGRKR